MEEHLFVMAEHDIELRRERRIRHAPPSLQPFDHLADEPRSPVAAAANHQSDRTRFLECLVGIVESRYIAIRDDRNGDSFLDPADEAPVGRAGIKLTARTAVYGNHTDPAAFGDAGEPWRVAALVVPSGTHLQGDRKIHRLYRCVEDPRGM